MLGDPVINVCLLNKELKFIIIVMQKHFGQTIVVIKIESNVFSFGDLRRIDI